MSMGDRWIVMLGTALETRGGISAVVNVYRSGGLFERWPVRYLPTHREGSMWSKFALALASLARFAGLLWVRSVAGVHIHSASRASFWRKSPFLLLSFLSRRPVLFHLHGGGFREFYEQGCGPLARAWVRTVFRHAAHVIVLSPRWEAWVRSVEPGARTRVIPNPAPTVKPRRGKPANDDPMLLFLGAMVEKKGVFDLLQAAALLRERHPRLRLVLGGTGAALEQVKQRARELNMGTQVEFPGWVDATKRDALLLEANVFVLPSYYEGLPMSILEAMAAGTPVVASDVGSIPEVIEHGVDGLLAGPGDVSALAGALDRLMTDAALCESLGMAAQRKIGRCYASERVLERVEDIYREVAGGRLPLVEHEKARQHA